MTDATNKEDLTTFEAGEIAGAADRSRINGDLDRGDWRRLAERACISLLNKNALDETVEMWRERYEETQQQLKHMEALLATFKQDLDNQRNTMIKALQVKYGHGPTA